jgi:hypothetical protein
MCQTLHAAVFRSTYIICAALLPVFTLNLFCAQPLQAYKQDPIFIEQLERQLLDFLSPSSKAPRLSLKAMPKAQRALVHEYAESGFGLVSHSTGNEPNRAVQVFKTPSSGAFGLWCVDSWLVSGFGVLNVCVSVELAQLYCNPALSGKNKHMCSHVFTHRQH